MEIRPATLEQRDDVIDLWRQAGLTRPWNDPRADFAFALGKESSDVLVGEINGAIVATAMVGHDGHRGWVYYLAVAPERQRQGLGAAMMAAVEQWQRDHGVWKLCLMVRGSNLVVRGFYEALGYAPDDVVVMSKRFAPTN
jgi:GNAT superfamily N-acetyltransferase